MPFFDLFLAILCFKKKFIFYQIENLISYKNIKKKQLRFEVFSKILKINDFYDFKKGAFEFMAYFDEKKNIFYMNQIDN